MGWSCGFCRQPEKAPLDLLLFVGLAFCFRVFSPKNACQAPKPSKLFRNKEIGVAFLLDQAATIKIVGKKQDAFGPAQA
jgi:hypothetical protein